MSESDVYLATLYVEDDRGDRVWVTEQACQQQHEGISWMETELNVRRQEVAPGAAHELLDAGRARDSYESDDGLQHRCGQLYDQLAAASWLSPWRVLDGAAGVSLAETAAAVTALT